MKNILKKGISILLLTPLFFACNVTTEEVVLDRNEKPVVNIMSTSVSVNEDGNATITISSDRTISRDMIFKLYQVEGNAVMGTDYTFAQNTIPDWGSVGGQITIPAFQTEGSVVITGMKDYAIDNSKAVFELRSTGSRNGVAGSTNKITVNIIDYIDENLGMTLSWDDGVNNLCDIDFDAYLTNFEAYMFTSNCPETVVVPVNPSNLITGVLTDGTKGIEVDLYDLHGANAGIAIPLTLTLGKVGQFSTTLDLSDLYTTNSQDSANGSGGVMPAGSIVVENGKYKIYDASGTLVFTEQ